MKKLVTLTVIMLTAICLQAQRNKDVPEFGKVDKTDLEMKECDFDKKAEALVLFDAAGLYCNITSSLDMELEHHVRIKILSDKGRNRADVKIRYHSFRNDEQIKKLEAQVYNLDPAGNVVATKVDKKAVYDKKIDKYWSEVVFTFPEAKAGSIIEYKYTHTNVGLLSWIFQRSIPVKYSRYRVDFPVEVEVYSAPMCMLPFDVKQESKGNRDIKIYTMNNIPALRDEPYISCDDDYLQRIDMRLLAFNPSASPRIPFVHPWPEIIKSLMESEDFGVQLKRNIPHTADLDEALKKLNDPYAKMTTIHEYVRKNMQIEDYSNIYTNSGVRSAWNSKKGTPGEINMILVNLLKDADLQAHPVLVSTRSNGRVNTAVSETDQFNRVMAYVTIGDKSYVLDGSDKYTPARLIPLSVMTTEGLVIEKIETGEWGWRVLWSEKEIFKDLVLMRADIDENGIMKGEAIINSYDYSRVLKMPVLSKGKDKFKEKYFTSIGEGIKIDSLTIENEKADSLALVQKLQFSMPVNSSGNYKYFSVNLFTGLEKNPFVADNRFSDVFFGANQSYNLVSNITIPNGYVFEGLPKSIRMIMPDTSISITRRIAAEKNQLSVRVTLEFRKPVFSVEEYPDFKEFYKKLFDILNEQIAIRKEN